MCFRKFSTSRMALSAAEKQRKYRMRRDADSERRMKYLQASKKKYKKDKESGNRKLAKDMTPRELRKQRKEWKQRQKNSRERKKEVQNLHTPPTTPPELSNQAGPSNRAEPSRLQRSRQLKRRTHIKQLKNRVQHLEEKLSVQTKKAKKYQRKLQRLASSSADTPRSKTKRLIGKAKHDINSKKTVCRTLEFHFSVMNQIKANKANRKRSISDIVRGEILRKYRFRTRASSLTGSRHPRIDKKIPKNSISARAKAAVTRFYEWDDVSRIT